MVPPGHPATCPRSTVSNHSLHIKQHVPWFLQCLSYLVFLSPVIVPVFGMLAINAARRGAHIQLTPRIQVLMPGAKWWSVACILSSPVQYMGIWSVGP